MQRMGVDSDEAPWFKTLHSFAYQVLNLKYNNVFNEKDTKRLATKLGLPRPIGTKDFIHSKTINTTDVHKYIYEQLRIRGCQLEDLKYPYCDVETLEAWTNGMKEYKDKFVKQDFIDMISRTAELDPVIFPEFKVLICDELQDLNKPQWEILFKLIGRAEKVYLAGDDDQCIYSFNGSDIDPMLNLEKTHGFEKEILQKSWRVPKSIWAHSQRLIQRLEGRYAKKVAPRNDEGYIESCVSSQRLMNVVSKVDPEDTVLFLSRSNTRLKEQQKRFGNYFFDKKKVEYSTIHNAKGKEADVVFLDLHRSKWTRKFSTLEEETRVHYVGMTRAKKKLYLLPASEGFTIDIS